MEKINSNINRSRRVVQAFKMPQWRWGQVLFFDFLPLWTVLRSVESRSG